MAITKHETCLEYYNRRLKEGWKEIKRNGFNVVLLSPSGFERKIDLRNDVETLRPDSAGDVTTIVDQFPAENFHWDKVDEAVADDNATYVKVHSTRVLIDRYDLYNLNNSGIGAGTINKITVYCVSIGGQDGANPGDLHIKVKTNGAEHDYDKGTVDNVIYTTYSQELIINPETTNAWTWAEIDALQVGPRHICVAGEDVRTTQVYVEVDYTSAAKPRSRGFIF